MSPIESGLVLHDFGAAYGTAFAEFEYRSHENTKYAS
jgi:hypothetical protein